MQFTIVTQKGSSTETLNLKTYCSQTKILMTRTDDRSKLLTLEYLGIVRVILLKELMQALNDSCLLSYFPETKLTQIQPLIYGRWALFSIWYCLTNILFKEMERY